MNGNSSEYFAQLGEVEVNLLKLVKCLLERRHASDECRSLTKKYKSLWISPFKNNPGFYINHSCNSSAGIRDSIEIVAMRDIKKGEEVKFDYSTSESENGWTLICQCGEENCRRLIESYELLPAELKLKYGDFTSEYLRTKK